MIGQNEEVMREYIPGDEAKLLKLFKQVFGVDRTTEYWNWRFKTNPQGHGWITVGEVNGEIVAHYGMMRNHLNFMGREIVVGQSCDTMVRFDQRNKRWFARLAARNYKYASENGVEAVFGFPNRNSYPGIVRTLEWHRITNLKYYISHNGYQKVWGYGIDRIFKYINKLLIKFRYLFNLITQKNGIKITVLQYLPDTLEDMLKEIRDYEVLSIWKDLRYLKWRYENHPDYRYLFHIISCGEKPEGLAITREHAESIAICDLLHRTKNVNQSVVLVYHILNYYATSLAQKVEFCGSDNGFFDAVFTKCGFGMVPYSGFVFGGKVFQNSRLEKMFIFPQNWTISYGDTDII